MSLWLYITNLIDLDRLRLIVTLKLLPKPQGVRYASIVQYTPFNTFGFIDNPDAKGFADKFNPAGGGGVFAEKVIL